MTRTRIIIAVWLTALAIYAVERTRPEPCGVSIVTINTGKPANKPPKFWRLT